MAYKNEADIVVFANPNDKPLPVILDCDINTMRIDE